MKKLLWSMMVIGLLTAFISDKKSCQRPMLWNRNHCVVTEQKILDATVRIVFHGLIEIEDGYDVTQIKGTISHATVIDGRYLLTHNHFGIPLSQIQLYNRYANQGFSGVSVYKLDGTAVLDHASLDSFSVVSETRETILLDFDMKSGEGFFTHAGIASAETSSVDMSQLTPNTEIALIDWDGQGHTRVVWVKAALAYEDQEVPLLQVDHFIELGASGGGVFWNGQHIGNNWSRITETGLDSGEIKRQLTIIALNF